MATRSMRSLYRTRVFSAKGRRVGRVIDVLMFPDRNSVAGYVVERPRLLWILDRKDRYLAHDRTRLDSGELKVTEQLGAWDKQAASRLGVDWESTVIWSGMPVRSKSGEALGAVREFVFDAATGDLVSLGLSSGVATDVAVGTRNIDAKLVSGFTDGAVVVADEASQAETSGGVAAAAGRGTVIARKQAAEAGVALGEAARSAAKYGTAAAKAAAKSKAGKKTIGWLKSVRDEVVDAMGDPDDD